MTQAAPLRRRTIAVAVAAALLAALLLFRWIRTDEPPATPARLAAPSPPIAGPREGEQSPSPVMPPRDIREAIAPTATTVVTASASQARPTTEVFDFAAMTPPEPTNQGKREQQFRTTDWFTEEDLRHPERYFELAERMPELNRPEERRDTLAF